MTLYRWRSMTSMVFMLLLIFILLTGCGGSSSQVQTKPAPPPPTPTPGPGQQLLEKIAHTINTARTLHGQFDLNITGQTVQGSIQSEIWNTSSAKNRTEVRQSTVPQIVAGSITVTDGKQIWQYDPIKKVVYNGPVPKSVNGTSATGNAGGGQNQLLLNLIQNVLTHSAGTLQSPSTSVNARPAYDIHVVPQVGGPNSGSGSLNYTGEIYIDRETLLPLQVHLELAGFGSVTLNLPVLVLNQPIPESIFTFAVPSGAKVLPLQQANTTSGNGSLSLVQAQRQADYHLLSIPGDQTDYVLGGVSVLGAPGNQIYALNYMKGNLSFTIAQGKSLANLPGATGQQISLRGTLGTLSRDNGIITLAWTEKGVGIHITGNLSNDQIISIAQLLS